MNGQGVPTDHEREKSRGALCQALAANWILEESQIDAILADREFFQPYLRDALARRAHTGGVPETPVDATDSNAILFLVEWGDASIIPDILKCLLMREEHLDAIYGDALTEDLWIPVARVGDSSLQEIWAFVGEGTVSEYVRRTVVSGVLAMPAFHPERRADVIAFVGRLVAEPSYFKLDRTASILCECADEGLAELAGLAEEFATLIEPQDLGPYPMATADDIRRAFDGSRPLPPRLSRPHDVKSVNRRWISLAEKGIIEDPEKNQSKIPPEPKIARNDPCPCGSGKKYKKCHGAGA